MRAVDAPRPSRRIRRRLPIPTLIAATLVSAVFAVPGTALAAGQPVPVAEPATTAGTTPTGPIGSPEATPSPEPQPGTARSSSPSASPEPSGSPRAAAAACGGTLALGEVVSCPSISGAERHVYTVTSTVDGDTLLAQHRQYGDTLSTRVTSATGESTCSLTGYQSRCRLGAAGSYTITVSLRDGEETTDYSLAVDSLLAPSSCTDLPDSFFSFASPGHSATMPTGAVGDCYRFEQPVGSVLHLAAPGGAAWTQGQILDAEYEPLCTVGYATECTLTRPGPYRLFLQNIYGEESSYTLRMPRITNAVGCPVLPLAAFGDPGNAVGTGTDVERDEVVCHALTAAGAGGVIVRISPDQSLPWRIYDAQGQLVCAEYDAARYCGLPAAGAYTLLVQSDSMLGEPIDYQVAVTGLAQTQGCTEAAGTTWDLPALLVQQTSPVQTHCQPFEGEAGDRIVHYTAPTRYNEAHAWLVDETGKLACPDPDWDQDGCVLPATGTYRMISFLRHWPGDSDELTYQMQIRRLSEAEGCPVITPGAYGAAPAGALGGIRCRVLDIPAAGSYLLDVVDQENYQDYARVYDTGGRRVCGTTYCEFRQPGRYTMVVGGSGSGQVLNNDYRYAVALLPRVPSGCEQVSDNGYATAPYRGNFQAAGEYHCLRLSSPAGARIIELEPGDASGVASPSVVVLDSTGAQLCDSSWPLRTYSCQLNGTAPFYAVLSAPERSFVGPYAKAFARVDGPPNCPVLPAGTTGSTVTTGADRFAVCLSLPADQRGSRESFTYRRTSGTGDASLSVFDASGIRYCGPSPQSVERTFTCTLPAGPVTVILEADGVDATYQLTHQSAGTPTS
ncbi:hypothetical protein [Plantactinospora soyae]|uniref:Ig-like domain-containing protein n=1 Tax=Plantactinospora soyae TaxID=1544732 RepID=A0A927M8G1_9ACTN|nr:hypothetical protein [Plantactinospora soyae]MBE1486400.1 hypothetical protein [Plantactinospora soyae]